MIGLFIFFNFILGSVLESCAFLRICSFFFFLGCPFYWFIVVCSILYFCDVSCNSFSFFISNFIDLSPLSFFLVSLAKGLCIFFFFSKNQLLGSLIFAIVFFVSISLISAPIFMISSFLLTLGFILFFL